jgi:hypothetical protein
LWSVCEYYKGLEKKDGKNDGIFHGCKS